MKQILLILLSILLIACNGTSKKKESIDSEGTNELEKKIDEYFSALNEMGKFNGIVFASKNDTLIINKAYNLNQDINSTTYVTTESQFDIHSVSKLMAKYI